MALKTATGIMDSILMQAGNATDHLSDDDAKLLRSVIELVETSIYGSMDSSHGADESALGMAISQIHQCNVDLTARLAPTGDLGQLHDSVSEKQTELNRLRGEMDAANATRQSEWEKFSTHMSMIREPDACPALPHRTMPALDVFFERSEYSIWFAAAQAEYVAHRDAFNAADDALNAAVEAYNLQLARRNTQYCDWEKELEQGCADFDTCFSERSKYYTDELTPRVQSDMASRIEAFKSGETLVQQIKFLLADSPTRETPDVDTSRFELGFPEVPAQRSCPLELLEDDKWVPTVQCEVDRYHEGLCWNIGRCLDDGAGACDWCGSHDGREQYCCRQDWSANYTEGHACHRAVFGSWGGHQCVTAPQYSRVACENPGHSTMRECTLSRSGSCHGFVRMGHDSRWTDWMEMAPARMPSLAMTRPMARPRSASAKCRRHRRRRRRRMLCQTSESRESPRWILTAQLDA